MLFACEGLLLLSRGGSIFISLKVRRSFTGSCLFRPRTLINTLPAAYCQMC